MLLRGFLLSHSGGEGFYTNPFHVRSHLVNMSGAVRVCGLRWTQSSKAMRACGVVRWCGAEWGLVS